MPCFCVATQPHAVEVDRQLQHTLETIAANTRRLREKQAMTQEQLAEAAGLDVTHVRRTERATVNVSVRVLVALSAALGVEPARLFHRARFERRPPGRPRSRS
jgi:transcriptional regulator with XRE-family HTH domain